MILASARVHPLVPAKGYLSPRQGSTTFHLRCIKFLSPRQYLSTRQTPKQLSLQGDREEHCPLRSSCSDIFNNVYLVGLTSKSAIRLNIRLCRACRLLRRIDHILPCLLYL